MKWRWIGLGILSISIIIGLGLLWHNRLPKTQASINFEPPSNLQVGGQFEVPLTISTTQTINAAEFYFAFPTNLVQVKQIKVDGSFFQLWVKNSPSFANDKGNIYLAGGLPTPGFSGKNGHVATVVFVAKQVGIGQITLDAKSRILLNDGKGTALPATYSPVSLIIR